MGNQARRKSDTYPRPQVSERSSQEIKKPRSALNYQGEAQGGGQGFPQPRQAKPGGGRGVRGHPGSRTGLALASDGAEGKVNFLGLGFSGRKVGVTVPTPELTRGSEGVMLPRPPPFPCRRPVFSTPTFSLHR